MVVELDPIVGIKRDLIRQAAREADGFGVTASAVLRAVADGETRPAFNDQLDRYASLRGLAREQVLVYAIELVNGPLKLSELRALCEAYDGDDLTADRAIEIVAWARRVQQSASSWQRTREAIVAIANDQEASSAT